MPEQWFMLVDDSSNLKGHRASIILEEPGELILEKYFCLNFQAINNQEEYKAVIAGLKLAKEVRVLHLLVQTDSQLVASQIKGDF